MFSLSTMIAMLLCIMLLATPQVYGFQTPVPMMAQPQQQQQRDTLSTSRRMTALTAVVSSRQAFLASSSAAAVVAATAVLLLPPVEAAHADEYDDARAAKRAKDAESKGAGTLAIPLVGGLALSLPFFLPNILRLLGVKNSKMKD